MKLNDAADALAAISQPTRLKVFRLLVQTGEGGLRAGDIASRLRIAKPTLSFHLKELRGVKLITSQRDGRKIIYRLNVAKMRGLMQFLTEDCCQGKPELCTSVDGSACSPTVSSKAACC